MAVITLDQGESFGHRHDEDSFTLLVTGEADLETETGVVHLVPGQRVMTPAHEHHSVVALSAGVVFECYHNRPLPPDPDPS